MSETLKKIDIIICTALIPGREAPKIIKEEMVGVANSDYHSFSIPLTVDINSGYNWGALH